MNREIKFRGFVYSMKKMFHWGSDLIRIHHDLSWDSLTEGSFNNKDSVLMQFTGLYDSEGREIYEGDILKSESFLTRIRDNSKVPNSEHVNYFVIEFNSGKKVNNWQLRIIKTTRYENFGLGDTSHSNLWTITDNSKIIGNIYENPDII